MQGRLYTIPITTLQAVIRARAARLSPYVGNSIYGVLGWIKSVKT